MAKGSNALTRGLSGMIGKVLVFRRVGNETIVSAAPVKHNNWSMAQQQLRSRFKEAAAYAKGQIQNPVIRMAYANTIKDKPCRTAYHAALTDFLNPPKIIMLDSSSYDGNIGNAIRICAEDDFRVTAVKVQVFAKDDSLLEEGPAVQQPDGLEWVYTATCSNANLSGCTIKALAYDVPGHEGVAERKL